MTAAAQRPHITPGVTAAGKGRVNPMVDNIGYWNRMVKLGYALPSPQRPLSPARFTGSAMTDSSRSAAGKNRILNSPDVPVTSRQDVTQSENSVFLDPEDEYTALNSNNSSNWISGYAQNAYGADALWSDDAGETWEGSVEGVNGANAGDPATAIGRNGWWYVGRISGDYGQSVSYSKDKGKTWKRVKAGNGPTTGLGLLDKNHLCIDNSLASPYQGNLYAAWTNFIPGSADTNQVQLVRSVNQGLNWSSPVKISAGAAALKLNHGVNLQTGPGGELYAAWSIYDSWPSDETAIGFARSFNGGGTFMPATRILSNIKGIRASETSKNMRVASFPVMAVDNSTGPHRGTIYIAWSNIGFPGVNTGTDIDIYLIKSSDQGTSWSAPVRVNQDPAGLGKQHFLPWMTCDPVTGGLCVVYYDDRSCDTAQVAAYVSTSYDGGNTWSDMQVSDVVFTPEPIPGLAFFYFGDYLGIQSENMKVYPVWTDNRDGRAMAWTSPFDLGPNPNQPWVTYYSDSLATVSGSGNVTMNNGDSLHLTLGLKNIGDQPAVGVNARVTSPSPYVTVTDSLAAYGNFAAGEIRKVPDGFAFKVSDTIPDGLMVRFDVLASTADSSWRSHFAIESHAPGLHINGLTVYDTLSGNRNGRLDPGEKAVLAVSLSNTGDFPCAATYCKLATTSAYLSMLTDSAYIGNIPAHSARNASFTVEADSVVPPSSGVDLACRAVSGKYEARKDFRVVIGMIVEDWESGTFTKFSWQFAGAKPWEISLTSPWEGIRCTACGAINDYQNSQLILTYNSSVEDSISFRLRTSTEQDYDFLMFSIDGVLQEQWSGETPWTRAAYRVPAGQHIFKWIYLKDLAFSQGLDRAWVDFIVLPPPVLPSVSAGLSDTVCAGSLVQLQGTVTENDSVRWTTDGDGVFDDPHALVTRYAPGTGDLVTGSVHLRLTAYNPYGNSAAETHIRINPLPVAAISAFPGDTACAGAQITLSADTTGGAVWNWLPGPQSGKQVVYDSTLTGGAGTGKVTLLVTSHEGCANRDSVMLTFKDCTGIPEPVITEDAAWPNPSDGLFFLLPKEDVNHAATLHITNAMGQSVLTLRKPFLKAGSPEKLDLSVLPDGVYLLTFPTARGTATCKLILRR